MLASGCDCVHDLFSFSLKLYVLFEITSPNKSCSPPQAATRSLPARRPVPGVWDTMQGLHGAHLCAATPPSCELTMFPFVFGQRGECTLVLEP